MKRKPKDPQRVENGYKRQDLLDEKGLFNLVQLASQTQRVITQLKRIAELTQQEIDEVTMRQEARKQARIIVDKRIKEAVKKGRFK